MVKIVGVTKHSRAEKLGIRENDYLLSINENKIHDVLDYRFYLTNRHIDLKIHRESEILDFHIDKTEYDDIGLIFDTPLMDKKKTCSNKCVFCFIDQLPKGLREPLYFKDDDSRLSFLHGNYITMTNLNEEDIERIIKMRISPVNISVHTTNPQLRSQMMHNKNAGHVLDYMKMLFDGGISICAQIVLCKGVNDGGELSRSMSDLIEFYPSLQSVSIVPSGLTKFRENLYPLEPFDKNDALVVIEQVNNFGDLCKEKFGTRLFYVADEFYLKAEIPIPDNEYYEDYSQIQNGVGMLRSFEDEFCDEYASIDKLVDAYHKKHKSRTVSVVTGVAAYSEIFSVAERIMEKAKGLNINVYCIKNNFFGDMITVSGLLTGTDIAEQLYGKQLGEELLIPQNCLRSEGDLFLCGMTPEELSARLSVIVTPSANDGAIFISALLGIK